MALSGHICSEKSIFGRRMPHSKSYNVKTVFVCDDHALFRDGEVAFLERYSDEFSLVGVASDGVEALSGITATEPDIVLLDLNIPLKNGMEVLRELRRTGSLPLVIVMTSYNDRTLLRKAKAAGANAYLLKDSSYDLLLETIRNVKEGMFLNNGEVSDAEELSEADKFKQLIRLTEREQELVREIIKGVSTPQIAERLFISENTVKNHRKNIYRKLSVSTVQELILCCKDHGLLD